MLDHGSPREIPLSMRFAPEDPHRIIVGFDVPIENKGADSRDIGGNHPSGGARKGLPDRVHQFLRRRKASVSEAAHGTVQSDPKTHFLRVLGPRDDNPE
ncbi:MAG: hypothetical protein ACLGXA_09575 [Acidobacteriota bacterium]